MNFKLFFIGLIAFSAIANADDKRPNVIIFLVDDLGWADISLRGAPIDTPAIDSLFLEGLTLDRFIQHQYAAPLEQL